MARFTAAESKKLWRENRRGTSIHIGVIREQMAMGLYGKEEGKARIREVKRNAIQGAYDWGIVPGQILTPKQAAEKPWIPSHVTPLNPEDIHRLPPEQRNALENGLRWGRRLYKSGQISYEERLREAKSLLSHNTQTSQNYSADLVEGLALRRFLLENS